MTAYEFENLLKQYDPSRTKYACGLLDSANTKGMHLKKVFSSSYKYAIKLCGDFDVMIVWDLERRRKKSGKILVGTVLQSSHFTPKYLQASNANADTLECHYAFFYNAKNERVYEKVMCVGLNRANKFLSEIELWMMLNPEDDNFPQTELDQSSLAVLLNDTIRKRYSVSRAARDQKFRDQVLSKYRRQCAICRCPAEKILEAAHIIAVENGGNDDPSNGICLCANHHRMFDKEYISIDVKKGTITILDNVVKTMPWYSVFELEYEGKLLAPTL